MWLSDRPLTQQKLADDLADLLIRVQPINFFTFLDAFWVIMAREWEGLDRYRLDKFYLLLRRYFAASLRRLKAENWDEDWVDDFLKIMEHIPLNLDDLKVPNGIRFHLFDIFLDEFERIMKEGDTAFTKGISKPLQSTKEEDKLPEYHTVDSDGEEESNDEDSDEDSEYDDDSEEEDEGWVEETEEEKAKKEQDKQKQLTKEQIERAKEWEILAKRIKEDDVPLKKLLQPLEDLAQKSVYEYIRVASQEVLDDERLVIWGVKEPKEEVVDSDEEWTGFN